MLDFSYARTRQDARGGFMNWEHDITSFSVEECQTDHDPLGYVVRFYKECDIMEEPASYYYEVGASFLSKRLQQLRRAGFHAPMTQKAIEKLHAEHRITSLRNRVA